MCTYLTHIQCEVPWFDHFLSLSLTCTQTCPGVHVRDILADAEARTTQWLLDEKERYKKEAEVCLCVGISVCCVSV